MNPNRGLLLIQEILLGMECAKITGKGKWALTVSWDLSRSCEMLAAVKLLVDNGLYVPAVVVTRCLFECMVNLKFIGKDVPTRLPEYLGHSGIPEDEEAAEKLKAEVQEVKANGKFTQASEWVPKAPWMPMKKMCEEVGLLEHYNTFYRLASEAAHGGAYRAGLELSDQPDAQVKNALELTNVVLTAVRYYLWVVEIANDSLKVSPDISNSLASWLEECCQLEQLLREQFKEFIQQ